MGCLVYHKSVDAVIEGDVIAQIEGPLIVEVAGNVDT